MASLRLPLPMVKVMAASKAQTKEPEKKSFIGWLAEKFEKEHMLETDPVLKKVEGSSSSNGAARPLGKTTLAAKKKGGSPPPEAEKKPGLFGGLFGN